MTPKTLSARQNAPVIQQVAGLDGESFDSWADNLLNVAMEIKNSVSRHVQEGRIGTYQAGGILACTMGQLFGYQDFHNPELTGHLLDGFGITTGEPT